MMIIMLDIMKMEKQLYIIMMEISSMKGIVQMENLKEKELIITKKMVIVMKENGKRD